MCIVIPVQTRRIILKPMERIPGYKPSDPRRIVPGIQVIQPGLRVPPVPCVAVRVINAARAADMVPESIVFVGGHHCAGGISQGYYVPVAVLVVVVGHAAADHGEQLVVWPVDIAGEKGAGGVGLIEHPCAGAVVEETGGAGGGGH